MSILDLPRLHFRGLCRIHAPTGNSNRGGHIDCASNTVYLDGRPYPLDAPPADFHRRLAEDGPRYDANGQLDPNGIFNEAAGWDLEGNGHCSWEGVTVVGAQTAFGHVVSQPDRDPVVGSLVDLWGHYNEYLGTTFNRARWVELDPSSRWTNQVLAGQVTIGRRGSSVDSPWMFSAAIDRAHAARWRKNHHITDLPPHVWASEFARADLFQFSVAKDRLDWRPELARQSESLAAFSTALEQADVLGLTFQYSLANMSMPVRPNAPVFKSLMGTVGLWCHAEMATYPSGRLLIPSDALRHPTLGNVTLKASSKGLSIYFGLGFGHRGRSSGAVPPGPAHALGPVDALGDLAIRVDGQVIARVPAEQVVEAITGLSCGVVDVAVPDALSRASSGSLEIAVIDGPERSPIHREQEWVVQVDDSTLSLEMPDPRHGDDQRAEVLVYSFHRGRPTSTRIEARSFPNPHGSPRLAEAASARAAPLGLVVEMRDGDPENGCGVFGDATTLLTDVQGKGRLSVRGANAGSTRVWLRAAGADFEGPRATGKSLEEAVNLYDNDNLQGFWPREGEFHVRVQSDDWHFDDVPDAAVDYAFLYQHVLAYYELVYPFMKQLVFSLADECKCDTYARLMWQMCDPRNRDKTYYMPPTRELSAARSRLFLRYLRNVETRMVVVR
jgi:hypothetical protein